jgi:hypothetical protein
MFGILRDANEDEIDRESSIYVTVPVSKVSYQ